MELASDCPQPGQGSQAVCCSPTLIQAVLSFPKALSNQALGTGCTTMLHAKWSFYIWTWLRSCSEDINSSGFQSQKSRWIRCGDVLSKVDTRDFWRRWRADCGHYRWVPHTVFSFICVCALTNFFPKSSMVYLSKLNMVMIFSKIFFHLICCGNVCFIH